MRIAVVVEDVAAGEFPGGHYEPVPRCASGDLIRRVVDRLQRTAEVPRLAHERASGRQSELLAVDAIGLAVRRTGEAEDAAQARARDRFRIDVELTAVPQRAPEEASGGE